MLLSIRLNAQLCLPRQLLVEDLFSHLHFHSPQGEMGSGDRLGSGWCSCALFTSLVVLLGQRFSQRKPRPSATIAWILLEMHILRPRSDLLNQKQGAGPGGQQSASNTPSRRLSCTIQFNKCHLQVGEARRLEALMCPWQRSLVCEAVLPAIWEPPPLGLGSSEVEQAWEIPKALSMWNPRLCSPSLTRTGNRPGLSNK